MNRPTILDLDLVVVPREATSEMIGAGIVAYDGKCEASYAAMLSASPYLSAWDDVRKYVKGLEEEVGRLEDENSELRYEPWPEWARAVLKVIRSHTGYDGYDDATEGVDMPLELSEHLSEMDNEAERLKVRAEAAEARIAELETRLADAERVIEPFTERANDYPNDYPDYLAIVVQLGHLRAARAYMEGK